ncbi:MAG: lipid-A-disaccharide synthase [Verrucomicrobia bacterium GWC2_42_7]|nr:MAG: lipid-A-disaccharide synthase [Verrucomicrobia bacterium GWC2_42_7]
MRNMLKIPFKRPDLLVIAGEHSGDEHAAKLISGFKATHPNVHVCAMGGRGVEQAGAELILDMMHFSVVGLFEVLKNYKFFKALIEETVNWIEKCRPKAILFVDYPGLNLYVADLLFRRKISRKGGGFIPLYYYISPQIWAWKARRRFKMERLIDSLGVIFPFEVDCFKDTQLPVSFVGHPFVDKEAMLPVEYELDAPILLLPGSRRVAVSRIFPAMLDAFELFLKKRREAEAVVLYPSEEICKILEDKLEKYPNLKGHIRLCRNDAGTVKGSAVLTSSGTMSLSCALAGIPGAIVYRVNWLTYLLGRLIVQIPYLGIANILLKETLYPEFIQHQASASNLCKFLESTSNPEVRSRFQEKAIEIRQLLSPKDNLSPAEWLSSLYDMIN